METFWLTGHRRNDIGGNITLAAGGGGSGEGPGPSRIADEFYVGKTLDLV